MKKLLLSLAMVGFAALGAGLAYASDLSCADWSYNNPQCAEYIQGMTGKAAFGMAVGQEKVITEGLACSDWSYNDAGCATFLTREATGKAAYGRVVGTERAVATPLCFDWNFDAACRGRSIEDLVD